MGAEPGADAPPQKGKTKTFLIGKRLKTKDLQKTSDGSGKRPRHQNQNQNPRIAYAERRVKPLARLLRCATALLVTAPLGCGSGVWYGRKVPFRPVHTARSNLTTRSIHPLSPREQRRPSDRPGAVQGAKRRSEPLTARTDGFGSACGFGRMIALVKSRS